jgi:hypothetical protein
MIGALIFLVAVMLLVGKMVMDVQIAKVKNILNQVKRMQVLAGIEPYDKEKGVKELLDNWNGVDIEGIEQLAERFQKLAHIQESSENVGKKGETTIYE